MNIESRANTTGASLCSIKPSARRSIHSHRGGCTFLQGEGMGTFSPPNDDSTDDETQHSPSNLRTRTAHRSPQHVRDQGTDEVDNVQSKLVKEGSPFTAENLLQKRNSLGQLPPYTEDSDSGILSKSYPQYVRTSPSHYSNDVGNLSTSRTSFNTSVRRYSRSPSNLSSNRQSPNISREHSQSQQAHSSTIFPWQLIFILLVAIVAALIFVFKPDLLTTSTLDVASYDKTKFYEDLNDLGGKYKIEENSIMQIQTGISTIFKRQDTGSFVFAYKSNTNNFNPDSFNSLVNTIASFAAKYLRNDSTSVQHIVVDGGKLEMRSHSELINRYRDDVTRTGVMVVREVDEVPSTLAMAFHYYCDEYNPLVKRSAIFFTLDMSKCSNNPAEQKASYTQIEKCLKKKWSDMPKDNINPLVNRVVSTIINVAGD